MNDAGIYDIAKRVMASPEFRLAYQGVAANTVPAQRALTDMMTAPAPGGQAAPVAPSAPVPVSVPGQSAQNVMPADKVDAAFRALGIDPAAARVAGAHQAAGEVAPDPRLAAALRARAGATAPVPGQQPAGAQGSNTAWVDQLMSGLRTAGGRENAGPLGRYLPEGVRNPLSDALTALAVSDPSAPPLTALGTGFAAAQAGQQARRDRKIAEQQASQEMAWKREDRAYQRERDQASDAREERKMTLDERRADIDERKSALEEIATAAGIQKTQAETAKIAKEYQRAGLTIDQQIKVEGLVNDRLQSQLGDYVTPEDRAAALSEAERYRSDLIEQFKSEGGLADTETGGTSEVPQSAPQGTGTAADPIDFGGAAGDAETLLMQKFKETGQPVYFRDETGQLREFVPAE